VGVLDVPAEEADWSQRLRVYFGSMQQYHARPKETDIGELMVTNLSSFPSALTVIAVPDGDIRRHLRFFIINEDLKRLGCSGRSGLTLSDPTPATQAKFLQLYKTSDRIPVSQAVLELIKLCQVALFIFGMLDQEFIDGLLCDVTETAINNWWTEIGSEYFNMEPTDGILGPTTVAALLGTLMGARNRLSYYGAPVSKDVFDIESTKRGIGTFQKAQKMTKTRRLDRQTLLKLHSATAKAAAGDGGWGVQKAVKSTVAEIGGKRGELVIGMVSGKDKANIGDIETWDLDKFINLASGERSKWLWHGKPRRTLQDHQHEDTMPPFGKDMKEDSVSQQSGGRRTQSMPLEEEVIDTPKKEDLPVTPAPYSAPPPGSATSMGEGLSGNRDALRKAVFKSVTGKVSDARSGLGRIRDAVGGGLRGHVSRPSKDEGTPDSSMHSTPSIATLAQSSTSLTSPVAVGRAFTWKAKPEEYLGPLKEGEASESVPNLSTATPPEESDTPPYRSGVTSSGQRYLLKPARAGGGPKDVSADSQATTDRKEAAATITDGSVAGSFAGDECDLQGPFLALERASDASLSTLHRRHSVHVSTAAAHAAHCHRRLNDARYPRRISFSEAEEAVLRWDEIFDISGDATTGADAASSGSEENLKETALLQAQAELARSLYERLHSLQTNLTPWVTSKISSVESLDHTLEAQQSDIQTLYLGLSEAHERIRQTSADTLGEERARLTEAAKDVEVLVARVEYEIGALAERVQDVEDGVERFESQVRDVERRAEELKGVLETESWLHWFVRSVTGIGTGPNITRGPSQYGRKNLKGGGKEGSGG